MTEAEASTLVSRLTEAFDRDVSDARRNFYLERLASYDYEAGRRAVNRLIDTEDRFPSLARLLAACQSALGVRQRPQVAELPMTNAERLEVAEELARESAARMARNGGHPDVWSVYLAEIAELYTDNAKRASAGLRLRPIPQIAEILRRLRSRPERETAA